VVAVALALGYFLGGEAVRPRTLLGTLLVLVSVIVITTASTKSQRRRRELPRPSAQLVVTANLIDTR
jgi:drug/metabolite transporter (DMT)-like permease